MTTNLKRAFEKAAELPEAEQDAFAQFLLEELEFVAAIQEGANAADRGETVPVDKVREMIPEWVSKSSSHDQR
jgi:predicted transcriptional regulator